LSFAKVISEVLKPALLPSRGVVLDFGGGDVLRLDEVSSLSGLSDNIEII